MTQTPHEPAEGPTTTGSVAPNRPLDPDLDAAGADRLGPDGVDPAPQEGKVGFGRQVVAAIKEIAIVVGLALVLSLLIKTFLFQAFWIPSGSMENTLVKDDRVIVTKLIPGPFDLQRGDIVVFEDPGPADHKWLSGVPSTTSTVGGPLHGLLVFVGLLPEESENHLIKRVIGLPGDHVQADGTEGPVKVNGVAIDETPYIKPGNYPSQGKAFDIVVPKDCVWVMGDHRAESSDSRFHDDGTGRTGCVPMDKIVGRALVIVWPLDHVTWLGKPDTTFAKVPAPNSTPAPAATSGTSGNSGNSPAPPFGTATKRAS